MKEASQKQVRSMREYAKQCIREDNPDHIILHVGTNELSSENDAERVGKSVADPAKSLLSENWKVIISGIVPQNDQWNNKAEQVNNHLKQMWSGVIMDCINHFENFNLRRHLSNSKLHLNEKGLGNLTTCL